jgi:hypothetical protein
MCRHGEPSILIAQTANRRDNPLLLPQRTKRLLLKKCVPGWRLLVRARK